MTGFDLGSVLFGNTDWMVHVLDVGASDLAGEQAPYEKLVRAGRARVVGFEPDAAACERLNAKYGGVHRFLPYFVGDGNAATFHETNWSLTGSLFRPNRPLLEKFQNLHEVVTLKAEHPVQTMRLDDIPEVGDVDFVKIDVQGAELAVFQGGERVLRDALLVQTEVEFVELYENQPLFGDVDRQLRACGYQFHTFAGLAGRCFKPLVVNNDMNLPMRQLLWPDAIYVRDWLKLDALSDEKLRKLAILLHEVVGSFDLCHLVLQALDARGSGAAAPRYMSALMNQHGGR
ncbi:MAG TPA: FkbM family methyltransferase [Burkholderiales bacterium]|nr:FkbM family methyltransferase [Burkholderiales bacterium]